MGEIGRKGGNGVAVREKSSDSLRFWEHRRLRGPMRGRAMSGEAITGVQQKIQPKQADDASGLLGEEDDRKVVAPTTTNLRSCPRARTT